MEHKALMAREQFGKVPVDLPGVEAHLLGHLKGPVLLVLVAVDGGTAGGDLLILPLLPAEFVHNTHRAPLSSAWQPVRPQSLLAQLLRHSIAQTPGGRNTCPASGSDQKES